MFLKSCNNSMNSNTPLKLIFYPVEFVILLGLVLNNLKRFLNFNHFFYSRSLFIIISQKQLLSRKSQISIFAQWDPSFIDRTAQNFYNSASLAWMLPMYKFTASSSPFFLRSYLILAWFSICVALLSISLYFSSLESLSLDIMRFHSSWGSAFLTFTFDM